MTINSSLVNSIAELDAPQSLKLVEGRISQGEDPQSILEESRKGMEEVGKKFETGEYFIADLMFAANIFERIMNVLGPEINKSTDLKKTGKILAATVKDDIHDIGKNLVNSMLEVGGFDVIDLGVDVSPTTICESIRENNPDIVALSCLLTSSLDSLEDTISEITTSGLRDKVKIIVGGIPLSAELAIKMDADAYGENAHEAVIKCQTLIKV